MERRETRSNIMNNAQDLKEGKVTAGSMVPLRKHLTVDKLAGGSHVEYLKSLEEGRAEEKNVGNSSNGSDKPKP